MSIHFPFNVDGSGNVTFGGDVTANSLVVDDITIDANTITSAGASAFTITAAAGQAVSVESVTFDGGAVAGVSTLNMSSTLTLQAGSIVTPAATALTLTSNVNGSTGLVINNTGTSDPYGIFTKFTNSAPDDRVNYFLRHDDSSGQKIVLWSDGGATFSGAVINDDTTDSTSAVTGSIQTDGGAGIAKSLRVGNKIGMALALSELTISSGVVTITKSIHQIDTEADAASDDLDTISGGAYGDILIIGPESGSRTVVAKDGTGNLLLNGDFTMDGASDRLLLYSDGTNWYELSRSDNEA